MSNQKRSLTSVHIAVLFFGLAGLFAKMVAQPAIIITLGRVFFSAIFLLVMFKVKKTNIRLTSKKDYFLILIAGTILAVHWTAFMQSIQTSTVAIGTLTFSTFPLFVTFLEPYFFHERLKIASIIQGMIMLLGVAFIIPGFSLNNTITRGVLWGMLSAITYAVLSLLNRRFSNKYAGSTIAFYEQGVSTIVLLPALFIIKPVFSGMDILGLLILGVVFTAVAHSMFIEGLKHIKVHTAGIISSLESVYGIIAAGFILKEIPSVRELIGGAIILGVVFYSTIESTKGMEKK